MNQQPPMVRVYYIGTAGAFNDRRLAGISPGYGQAVDMPKDLADEMVRAGLFSRTEPQALTEIQPNRDPLVELGLRAADKDTGPARPFVEIEDHEQAGEPFVEIQQEPGALGADALGAGTLDAGPFPYTRVGGPSGSASGQPTTLLAGNFPGLGPARRRQLAKAGITTWQSLAALEDGECEKLGIDLDGITPKRLKEWRDSARERLAT